MEIIVSGRKTFVYTGGRHPAPEEISRQPVVLFIHGAQQDHSCWAQQSRWFAHHGFSVLAPDLPGHGASDGLPLPTVEALASWIAALLDVLGVEKATLVGHSLGSLVALETSLRFPERLHKLALIGSSLPMPVSPVLLDAARDDEIKAAAMINAWSYSPAGQFGGNTVPGLWLLGINRRLMARQKPGVFHVDMTACNAYTRHPESLKGIAGPVLIIAGKQDKMTPPKAAKLLQGLIPGAKLMVIDGSGHALMAEKPDAVLDSLRQFIVG